ncbi:MAG: hypothetical protein U9R08_04070 [Nanoarchaeota archaeon]|nr:hypothetical protein [Nanoarchaeota archaeon]
MNIYSFEATKRGRVKDAVVGTIDDTGEFVVAIVNPKLDYFDPLKVHAFSNKIRKKSPKQLINYLKRRFLAGKDFYDLGPGNYKPLIRDGVKPRGFDLVNYKAGLSEVANVASASPPLYLGMNTPYGAFSLISCLEAAKKFVWQNGRENIISKEVHECGDIYSISGYNDKILIQQDGVKLRKRRLGSGQSNLFDTRWRYDEFWILLHRQFNEHIDTPLFFPLMGSRMTTIATAIENAFEFYGHNHKLLLEVYLQQILLDSMKNRSGLNSYLRFDAEPLDYNLVKGIDFKKVPLEFLMARFEISKLSASDFFMREVEQGFKKLSVTDRKIKYLGLASQLPEKLNEFTAVLDMANIFYSLFLYFNTEMVVDKIKQCDENIGLEDLLRALEKYNSYEQIKVMREEIERKAVVGRKKVVRVKDEEKQIESIWLKRGKRSKGIDFESAWVKLTRNWTG